MFRATGIFRPSGSERNYFFYRKRENKLFSLTKFGQWLVLRPEYPVMKKKFIGYLSV